MGFENWEAWGGDVRTYVRTDGRTDGRKEIHPCVLQDIGPLGPLPKKWNEIPDWVKEKESINAFKNAYDKWATNQPRPREDVNNETAIET